MHHERALRRNRADRSGRSLHLARLVEGELKPCGSAGSGLSEAAVNQIRVTIDAGRPVVVEVERRSFTPDGELRHPVIRGWEIG
jgi:bifunctional non-homologous end joining protein LigD